MCQVWIDQRQVREEMAAVKLGCWITVDKSHCAGWYNSPCTIEPNLKPISTGATLHSLDVTHEKLKFYKLYTCTYDGKHDGDLQSHNPHTAGEHKFV